MIQSIKIIQQITQQPFYFITMSQIIAPHGITDIVHAYHTNKTKSLLLTYSGIPLIGQLCHLSHLDDVWYGVFFISSIIHFHHDFPVFTSKNQYLASTLLVLCFMNTESLLPFFLYMISIHVPNHYKTSWSFVKSNVSITLFLVGLCSVVNAFSMSNVNDSNISFLLSIVIAHIVYEEIQIHNINDRVYLQNDTLSVGRTRLGR